MFRHRFFCALRKAGKIDVHIHGDVYVNVSMIYIYTHARAYNNMFLAAG
jgi:hypothetical protein